MTDAVRSNVAFWAETFRTLIAPIILFLLAIFLILWDGVLDPPTEAQGASGLALVLIAMATGLGIDLIKIKGSP